MAFAALLELDGANVISEPWTARRERLKTGSRYAGACSEALGSPGAEHSLRKRPEVFNIPMHSG